MGDASGCSVIVIWPKVRGGFRDVRVPKFHVTHVDAHADLGLGDSGYVHLITEVMHRPVAERSLAEVVAPAINFSNWLAFAVACRWVADIDYVFGEGGGSGHARLPHE
jgi:hypothetical protein